MKPLPLADCIRSTPGRTLVALTRELSHRARRSLVRDGSIDDLSSDQAHEGVMPVWQKAVRVIAAGRTAPTRH